MKIEIEGTEHALQIKDYLSTEEYFQMLCMTHENQSMQMKMQTYFLVKTMVINPKLTDKIIDAFPFTTTLRIGKKIRELTMPDKFFLELGVQPDALQQG